MTEEDEDVELVCLQAGGVGVVLALPSAGPPAVLHWGRDLGTRLPPASSWQAATPRAGLETRPILGVLGGGVEGASQAPALVLDPDWLPRWTISEVRRGPQQLHTRAQAEGLALTSSFRLDEHGVLLVEHEIANTTEHPVGVQRLDVSLPLPARAVELLDQTGRWGRERQPQRVPWSAHGTWLREGRHGRPGHDNPLVLAAGTAGFSDRAGEVWGVHLAWSGDVRYLAERRPDGRAVVAAGELLGPGEVVLAPGETYRAPTLVAAWSGVGLDGLSGRLHRHVRSRSTHPRTPRPATINTWEAVYFDHDADRLFGLAEAAAAVGLERFVLDDGWFRGRRDDLAGLGDWEVDPDVYPDGLTPLITEVNRLGMQFGLWVEPEMVNEDSDLYRAHPDWILRPDCEVAPRWRHQQVLDLTRSEVYDHILGRLDALLGANRIDYLKWDHNRDLVGAASRGRPAVHAQTKAVYRLLDELRRRHPGVEIESCASGGGRVDLGILARTERVWPSDTNDALERLSIQRWTQLLLPPELVGSHIGPPRSHTTGRTHDLSFRGAIALFGHLGVEWDIVSASPAERDALARVVAAYKTHRGLLHSGEVVHGECDDPGMRVHGVVARDAAAAIFACVALASPSAETWPPVRLPGLLPGCVYRVGTLDTGGAPLTVQGADPPWWPREGGPAPELASEFLGEVGLPLPVLAPEHAVVLHLERV